MLCEKPFGKPHENLADDILQMGGDIVFKDLSILHSHVSTSPMDRVKISKVIDKLQNLRQRN